MASRHYNIPIFLPELACPHRCIFCNQSQISGVHTIPQPAEVEQIILNHLTTIPADNSSIQIAFFGGSFTALPLDIQKNYLEVAAAFIPQQIDSIRISTRPDYINNENLELLKFYGVKNIELGAQSLHNEVLKLSARGHSVADVEIASQLILEMGFELGLQMMIGLPGDNDEFVMATAQKIVSLGATETRIYPTLVIKDTPLEKLWISGKYLPLQLNLAVQLAAKLYLYFLNHNIRVLRVGLYPSSDFACGVSFLAGPFHPNFKELVLSEIWRVKLDDLQLMQGKEYKIFVSNLNLNHAIGFSKSNLNYFRQKGIDLNFIIDNQYDNFNFHVDNW
jgi:histone acetyltransferase (RNA polymerase elongator complex component)